ncbi:retrovirus-related pol polyprotein from transposon TNT 1-94 [Tanacetum coccineum]
MKLASATQFCLMLRASSTKSWLWHQRYPNINFDNTQFKTLPKLTLSPVFPKFKSTERAPCPSCEQGKSKGHLITQTSFQIKQSVGISHQASSVRTPQQNGVVERRNRTLVEAARTMLIFSRAPLFLWAEAIATACYTQNRSIIHRRFNKTPYELINGRKTGIPFLHYSGLAESQGMIRENIGKLGAKAMAFEQSSLKPELQSMTSGQISSRLDLTYAPSTITTQKPTEGELDLLFEAMYDDFIGGQPSPAPRTAPAAQAPQALQTPTATTTTADSSPTPIIASSQATDLSNTSQDVDELDIQEHFTRNQLRSDGRHVHVRIKCKHYGNQEPKEAMTDPAWIESMQEELLQFKKALIMVRVAATEGRNRFEEVPRTCARMQAIRIFLAYVAHKSFTVFQMDVKTAFLHGTLKEDVYVCQPEGLIDADHTNHSSH